MKYLLLFLLVLLIIFGCSPANKSKVKYSQLSKEQSLLHDSIVSMDNLFFEAYNTCKLNVMEQLISEDIEFYHDQGGLSKSKTNILQALKNNICGKVTRELLSGSIEVYPIRNFGAVEMGKHRFHNNQEEKNNSGHFSKFVHIWKKENGQWKITRVISLH